MSSRHCDIAIVGGGLVGASLASALTGLGLRIALIEAVPMRQASQPSYDDRTLALSLASCRIFEAIGLWPGVRDGVTPIQSVHISDRGRFGSVTIRASELDVPWLGQVAEGRLIGEAVHQRLPSLADLDLLCPARVTALEHHDEGVELGVQPEDGESVTLRARLLVGADGAQSWVRRALKLPAEEYDYQQTAVIANVTPDQPHENRAFERFTRTGPLAMLPHVGRRCGVVWTVPGDEAESLLAKSDEAFLDGLQHRFGFRLGRLRQVGRRSSYPLRLVYAKQQHRQRSLIIGNAAHAIHPISAQGFNLGLRDVAVLAELVADAHRDGSDIGSQALLETYRDRRQRDHQRMIAYTDGLVRIFSQTFLPVRVARSAGLQAIDMVPGLKRALARRTMGFGGHVPRLARGKPLVTEP